MPGSDALHGALGVGNAHIPYNWTYADQAAREAEAGAVAGDVGKLARQLDDNTLWMLIDDSPLTWAQVGGSAGSAPTDYAYIGFGTHSDLSAEVNISAMSMTNEICGWPPQVADGTDLVTAGLWFRDVGTPTTKATVVDVAGEGLTATYKRAAKCVGDGANDGLKNLAWTYANEHRTKVDRVLSARCYVWCVGGVGVTAKLVNSDASETAATKVTAAAWTLVEIPNHTLAGTSCELQFLLDGAGTFYVAELSANIGPRALPLPPRPLRYVESIATLVNNVDPGGGSWTDVDCTANSSALAAMVNIDVMYQDTTNANTTASVRRNGDGGGGTEVVRTQATTARNHGSVSPLLVDDGQIFEYDTSAAAGDTESLFIYLRGFWEWA